MWSIRMRAGTGKLHISGAETITEQDEIITLSQAFLLRALCHPKGLPSEIVLTVEKLKVKPVSVPVLKVTTLECPSPFRAKNLIKELLRTEGISELAIKRGLSTVYSERTMRGASLIEAKTGRRLEPDRERGVRVSRLGISRDSEEKLSSILESLGINTTRVKEALILASKVASCPGIMAEVCISDDPDYTTGYVASQRLGYQRIPNIKEKGSKAGGRVFFVKEGSSITRIIRYLEKKPVLVEVNYDIKNTVLNPD
ncbi:MAG: 6-carboxyhexanoate--CoA ligase [Thermodesulfovibrionales bacterium]|nr:6-carboxyhexanoate--CoA ligase [Thermodesulfovibrionales bacterium]